MAAATIGNFLTLNSSQHFDRRSELPPASVRLAKADDGRTEGELARKPNRFRDGLTANPPRGTDDRFRD